MYSPPVPLLSHLDPIHNPTSNFVMIRRIIILASTPVFPKWSITLRFPHQIRVYAYHLNYNATCPVNLIFIDFITLQYCVCVVFWTSFKQKQNIFLYNLNFKFFWITVWTTKDSAPKNSKHSLSSTYA